MKLPGFIDAHMHMLGLGYVSYQADLTQAKSIADIAHILKPYLNQSMVIGRGWNQEWFREKRMLTKQDLNQISSDQPLMMIRVCGHVLTVNDKLLEMAGINASTPQIEGGLFNVETGIFSEKALSLIYQSIPLPTREDLKKYLIKANEILLANGVTAIASDDFSIFPIPFEKVIDVFNELYDQHRIQVKVTEQVNLDYKDLQRFIGHGYVNQDFGPLKMGPLKILADGSLGGRTAYLKEPYSDAPDERGIHTYSDEALFDLINLADRHGMDSVIHTIGDAAVDQVLAALIKSIEKTGRYPHQHALIHAQLTNRAQIQLMKQYDIGAIVQPIFLNSDIPIIRQRIGQRADESYLFKTMADQDIHVGFSTDSPIEPVNPLKNIYCAMTRKSIDYPNWPAFLPEEGFDFASALTAYTTQNLRYIYEKALPEADYILLDQSIDPLNPETLLAATVLETVIDGQVVFKKNDSCLT